MKHREQPKPVAIDRRAARTRNALHGAMISLILRKDYEAISVQDIADEANVGRSTFYAHFAGKEHLLRTCGEWLRTMLIGHRGRGAAHDGAAPAPLLDFARVLFEHTREQRALYRAMVGGRAGAIFLEAMREVLMEAVRADLAARGLQAVEREMAVRYVVGGFMSVLAWWLDGGAKEPPERMEAAFRALALNGLPGR